MLILTGTCAEVEGDEQIQVLFSFFLTQNRENLIVLEKYPNKVLQVSNF
jgi:hypothetical protein